VTPGTTASAASRFSGSPSWGLWLAPGGYRADLILISGLWRHHVGTSAAGPGHGSDGPGVEGFAAVRAGGHDLGDVAAGGVKDLDGWAVGGGPRVTPLSHGGDDWPQVTPLVSEAVLVAGRMLLVGDPGEDALVDESGEPLVEDAAGDPEAGLEVVEAANAEEGVAQDEQ
jgi:hypothetical protein